LRAAQHPFPADLSRNDRKETPGDSAKRDKTWALDPHQTKPLSPDSYENPAIAAAIRDYQRCGGVHFWTVYSPHNGRYTGIIASATG
jgi:two component system regulatory protein